MGSVRARADAVYALTGGQDALVNAYLVSISTAGDVKVSSTPRFTLVGHSDNVCTLGVYGSEYIVSGSWDATVRVWKDWTCVETFTKHTLSVWSVLPIDAGRFVSASADKSVYLWAIDRPKELLASYTGAKHPVRGLARVSDTAFASAGNDATVRTYPLEAGTVAPAASMTGHTSFVYALASPAPGVLVSSGEDHTVRVWKGGALAQVLTLPATSVWCVCALANGDLACGTSDGQVRVFTTDAARTSAERIAAFDASVAAQVLAAAELDAATPAGERSLLAQPGREEGATCIVRDGSRSEVHRWSTHANAWKLVGHITDAAGATQKKMLGGKAYDYVFDVDVEDGAPPLKLPYNANENPYEAAQRFLQQYQLPASYLDQVVQFLQKNTQAVGLGSAAPAAAPAATGAPLDPYTGDSGLTSAPRSLQVLPHRQYLAFQQANLAAARAKIGELAGADAPLSDAHAAQLDALVAALERGATADVGVLHALLGTWPLAKRFPLLDLLRVAAAKPCSAPFATIASDALIGADWDALETQSDRKAAETNAMLVLRTLANGFVAPDGSTALNDMALEVRAPAHPDACDAAAAAVARAQQARARRTRDGRAQLLGACGAHVVCARRAAAPADHRGTPRAHADPRLRQRQRGAVPCADCAREPGTCRAHPAVLPLRRGARRAALRGARRGGAVRGAPLGAARGDGVVRSISAAFLECVAVVVDVQACLAHLPADTQHEKHRLERARDNVREQRRPVGALARGERVHKQHHPRHLQAHRRDAQAAHEARTRRVHNLRQVLEDGEERAGDAQEARPVLHDAVARAGRDQHGGDRGTEEPVRHGDPREGYAEVPLVRRARLAVDLLLARQMVVLQDAAHRTRDIKVGRVVAVRVGLVRADVDIVRHRAVALAEVRVDLVQVALGARRLVRLVVRRLQAVALSRMRAACAALAAPQGRVVHDVVHDEEGKAALVCDVHEREHEPLERHLQDSHQLLHAAECAEARAAAHDRPLQHQHVEHGTRARRRAQEQEPRREADRRARPADTHDLRHVREHNADAHHGGDRKRGAVARHSTLVPAPHDTVGAEPAAHLHPCQKISGAMPPRAASGKARTPKRAPGPGKQPKSFTEDQGMAHLLALSEQAVSKTDSEYQHRVDRTHAAQEMRAQAEKERRKKKQEARSTSDKPTRAAMIALLREKRREKSRARKTQRRLRDEEPEEAPPGPRPILKTRTRAEAPKKRVSFG